MSEIGTETLDYAFNHFDQAYKGTISMDRNAELLNISYTIYIGQGPPIGVKFHLSKQREVTPSFEAKYSESTTQKNMGWDEIPVRVVNDIRDWLQNQIKSVALANNSQLQSALNAFLDRIPD